MRIRTFRHHFGNSGWTPLTNPISIPDWSGCFKVKRVRFKRINEYRMGQYRQNATEPRTFSGRTIDVVTLFIAGKRDWNTCERPGVLDSMQKKVCTQLRGVYLVDGAGNWVQQEQRMKWTECR
jgi:hypothetical protein